MSSAVGAITPDQNGPTYYLLVSNNRQVWSSPNYFM